MEGKKLPIDKLLMNMDKFGDCIFSVGPENKKEEVKGVVFLLRSLSPVFNTMFNDDWRSQRHVIRVPDIEPEMFRVFLKLMLSENLTTTNLRDLSIEDILHLLYIAKKYDVDSIQSICRASIKKIISVDNVILIYEALGSLNEPELEKKALNMILVNIKKLLLDNSFVELSRQGLAAVLKCEELSILEVPLFKGLCCWAKSQCDKNDVPKSGKNIRKMLGDLLFLIRFPVMSIQDLYNIVQPMEILTPEELVEISSYMVTKRSPSFVSRCLPFSVKERPNVTNDPSRVTKLPVLEQCFVYTPRYEMNLSRVVVESTYADPHSLNEHSLKISISDGVRDILPMVTKTEYALKSLVIFFDKRVVLEPNKKYYVNYEVKIDRITPLSKMSFYGSTQEIRITTSFGY